MKKFPMCFNSDRILVLERALDIHRSMLMKSGAYILSLMKSFEDAKQPVPAALKQELDNNVRYWDIATELSVVVEDQRRKMEDESEIGKMTDFVIESELMYTNNEMAALKEYEIRLSAEKERRKVKP